MRTYHRWRSQAARHISSAGPLNASSDGDAPNGEAMLVRRARPMLGTIVEIALASDDENAFEQAFGAIARIHALMSFHEGDSDLARIRRAMPEIGRAHV